MESVPALAPVPQARATDARLAALVWRAARRLPLFADSNEPDTTDEGQRYYCGDVVAVARLLERTLPAEPLDLGGILAHVTAAGILLPAELLVSAIATLERWGVLVYVEATGKYGRAS
jgi:hypothetical protein